MSHTRHTHTHSLCPPCMLLAGSLSTWISVVWKHSTDTSWQFYTWFRAAAMKVQGDGLKQNGCVSATHGMLSSSRWTYLTLLCIPLFTYIDCVCVCVLLTRHVTYGNHWLGEGCEGRTWRQKQDSLFAFYQIEKRFLHFNSTAARGIHV